MHPKHTLKSCMSVFMPNSSGNPTDPVKNSPTLNIFFLFSETKNSKIEKRSCFSITGPAKNKNVELKF